MALAKGSTGNFGLKTSVCGRGLAGAAWRVRREEEAIRTGCGRGRGRGEDGETISSTPGLVKTRKPRETSRFCRHIQSQTEFPAEYYAERRRELDYPTRKIGPPSRHRNLIVPDVTIPACRHPCRPRRSASLYYFSRPCACLFPGYFWDVEHDADVPRRALAGLNDAAVAALERSQCGDRGQPALMILVSQLHPVHASQQKIRLGRVHVGD